MNTSKSVKTLKKYCVFEKKFCFFFIRSQSVRVWCGSRDFSCLFFFLFSPPQLTLIFFFLSLSLFHEDESLLADECKRIKNVKQTEKQQFFVYYFFLSFSISFHAAEMYLLYSPIVHTKEKNHGSKKTKKNIFMRTRWWLLHLIAKVFHFL